MERPEPPPLVFGVKWWNRPNLAAMWGKPVDFASSDTAFLAAIGAGRAAMAWASRAPVDGGAVDENDVPFWRIEDGFIRSPGLGAHFSPAYSLIFDDIGIYYDATRPSRLETMLEFEDFDTALLDRARKLRQRLIALAVSKYAVGQAGAPDTALASLDTPANRDRILVVGQVEDDASIRLGGADIRTNLALIQQARETHPAAWIAYKPHPDVTQAGRPGFVAEAEALRTVDAVWPTIGITQALDWADAVHTISSLAGFEALLRGKTVHVHGRPFYAGWGLTQDHAPMPTRRTRTVALDALVAATLILYPRYLDPITRRPCTPEQLLDRIAEGWADPLLGRPTWHRAAARIKRTLGPLRSRL